MNFKGCSDYDLVRQAAASLPVAMVGACVFALFSVVSLGKGRHLTMQEAAVAKLIAQVPALPQDAISLNSFSEGMEAAPMSAEVKLVEGRSTALISILNHGNFGRGDQGKPTENAKKIVKNLEGAATATGRAAAGVRSGPAAGRAAAGVLSGLPDGRSAGGVRSSLTVRIPQSGTPHADGPSETSSGEHENTRQSSRSLL